MAVLAAVVASTPSGAAPAEPAASVKSRVRVVTIAYRAHNGARRAAHVVVPAWYGPRHNPPLPLIISPHGRGQTGRDNAALWGDLPAQGPFAVVNPDGQGRRLPLHSWGFSGQVDDLARMPDILRRALPWLRIDRRRIYAFGGSMGGQETLLLIARHPRLLAGAAVFDSVIDLALQYRRLPGLICGKRCQRIRRNAAPWGRYLQRLARREIGGPPGRVAAAYAARSPLTYLYEIAYSCVPLQMWWSTADRIVVDEREQSGKLFWAIKRLNRDAPVSAFVGHWIHSSQMRATSRLPLALASFDLLLEPFRERGPPLRIVPPPVPSGWCARDG